MNGDKIDPKTIILWNDLRRLKFKGRVMLLNDVCEVFTVALRILGYPINTANPEEIKAAFEKLQTLAPNAKTFNFDAARMPFVEGGVDIGQVWSGKAYRGKAQSKQINVKNTKTPD